MPMMRRRPLLRAAAVGTVAYKGSKRGAMAGQNQAAEAAAPQPPPPPSYPAAPPPPPPPAPPAGGRPPPQGRRRPVSGGWLVIGAPRFPRPPTIQSNGQTSQTAAV